MTALLIVAGALLLIALTFAVTVWAVATGTLEVYMTRSRKERQAFEISFFRWGVVFCGGYVSDFYIQLRG